MVHLDYADARRILGDDKIIGISVSDASQAEKAAATGCDYIGVGPVFATNTKPDHNPALGVPGFRSLLEYISTLPGPSGTWGKNVPSVAIGGINLENVQRVVYQSQTLDNTECLDGVAVVSAIIGSTEPKEVCAKFILLLSTTPPFAHLESTRDPLIGYVDLNEEFKSVFLKVSQDSPMIHHITNNVVKGFSANITLAVGASPIMSEDASEMAELANYNGALVLNMGTASKSAWPDYCAAVVASNARGVPVVFDPVGAGATSLRRETSRLIVSSGYCDIIKGNELEIRTVYGDNVQQRGVDSSRAPSADPLASARIVKALARRERNIVVMTGVVDYVSDGNHTFSLSDGHYYQSDVTGTGCSLGSVIAACVSVNKYRILVAVLAAVSGYNAAARIAAGNDGVEGPGSWQPMFLDRLYELRDGENNAWASRLGESVKMLDV